MQTDVKKEVRSQLKFNSDGSISIPDSVRRDIEKEKKFGGKYSFSNQRENKKFEEDLDIFEDDDNLEEGLEENVSFDERKYNLSDSVEGFNLYDDSLRLNPLIFSNGKSQEDVVNEIVNEVENGIKVIFIRGVCGTGKSAIALNIAKKLGRASIVVPGKALQKQYKDDYSREKYVLKNDHKKLKIKVITGRANHKCLYKNNASADDADLPCKIEIKEKNMDKIREYLNENNKVKKDLELKEIRRISVAPVCPYWSPIVPSELDLPIGAEKRKYTGLKGIRFSIYNRKSGCSYYNQFNSYIDSEVIVFNSAKYLLEVLMNRKPETDVEIIDECDEFLDSFSNTRRINFSRLSSALMNLFPDDENLKYAVKRIFEISNDIIKDGNLRLLPKDIVNLQDSPVYTILKYFLDNPELVEGIDEENYCNSVYETAVEFDDFLAETFVSYVIEERGIVANIATTNLAKRFKDLLDKNKVLVFMSGTLHSETILKEVFGINNFKVIDAEIINQGSIEIKKTGREVDCKYENFANKNISREDYLVALDSCIALSVRPTLVHVQSFEDLPSENEKLNYSLRNLVSKEYLIEQQKNDSENRFIDKFKKGDIDILFTTKCARGIDFPGEQCNSIVFTKYPNPNVQSVFWKILNKTHKQYYWEFYRDKARRDFLQKIYRGVRSKEDKVFILSPDSRVLDAVSKINHI